MTSPLDEQAVAREVVRRHGAHTVLLYGSYARGAATPTSDVDLIALRASGGPARDVSPWKGYELDVHVFDDAGVDGLLEERTTSLAAARVLLERGGAGTRLCEEVRRRLAASPPGLADGEWAALWAWGSKMRGRIRTPDPTVAAFHVATVLVEAPGAWCEVRRRWFLGPKATIARWEDEDPRTLQAYRAAARPGASPADVDALLDRVFDAAAA